MITYGTDLDDLTAADLRGFFVGWPARPGTDQHLAVLRGSHRVVLAYSNGRIVGFVHAISDGVLTAFIPWLEVLPDYRNRGIGAELIRRILAELRGLYSVDLACDPELRPYYERLGMLPLQAMGTRDRTVLR